MTRGEADSILLNGKAKASIERIRHAESHQILQWLSTRRVPTLYLLSDEPVERVRREFEPLTYSFISILQSRIGFE